MACFHPLTAYYPLFENNEGKRPLSFRPWEGRICDGVIIRNITDFSEIEGFKIKIPCGKCIGCRLDYSRHWALRSVHEARMSSCSCFVTLTFNNEHLPSDMSVHKNFIQTWMKRFRKYYGEGIRYMLCGEYGAKRGRPHYHIIFYDFDFDDKYIYSIRHGNLYYRSPSLEKLWTPAGSKESLGFSIIGECNFETSAYVARYVTKKVFGKNAYKHYVGREPEFMLTSRRPGLGNSFFYKYYTDMFNLGYVVCQNGNSKMFKAPIPRYYQNLLKEYDFSMYKCYKLDKEKKMYENLFIENIDETRERLLVREELQNLKLDKLVRFYEDTALLHNIYYKYITNRYKMAIKSLKLLDVDFNLNIDDARNFIALDNNTYNYIFLDAFTPAKCPCLWTVDFFKLLYSKLDENGMVLTYSNSAAIRNAFVNAGFCVGKIYSESANKFTGTIAAKNNSLIKHELSEYDLGLLKSKAGIFYRDSNLKLDNEAIIEAHKIEVQNSDLISSSSYIKQYKKESIK